MKKYLIKKISSLAVLSVFLSFQFISTAYAGLTWSAYGSDIPMNGSTIYVVKDFVYDNAGTMHIAGAALDTGAGFVTTEVVYGYTTDGTSFNWTTVDDLTSEDFVAQWPARIKLDGNGNPGILYFLDDEETGGGAVTSGEYTSVRFAHSNSWTTIHTIAEIDLATGALDTPGADFDFLSNGNPEVYICYDSDASDLDLYRHAWSGGTFPTGSFPAVDSGTLVYDTSTGGDTCQAPKIEIDSTDKRHVVFANGGGNKSGAIKYLNSSDGTTWGTPDTIFSNDSNRINGADIIFDGSTEYPIVMSVLNSGSEASPTNTIQITEWNGSSWTTPEAVVSSINAGFGIPDDVMNQLHSVSNGYEYVSWRQSSGDDHQVAVANNESGSWITDVAASINDSGLMSTGMPVIGYDTPYNKVTVYNLHSGNTTDNQFYQATSGDDAATGGAVPEFEDYMLLLTVMLAVGMMTRQKDLLGKLSA